MCAPAHQPILNSTLVAKMAVESKERQNSINDVAPSIASVREGTSRQEWNKDEYTLAKLGYKQGKQTNQVLFVEKF